MEEEDKHHEPEGVEALLVRFCSGETTEQEAAKVEQWIAADDENRRTAEQIHAICLAADTLTCLQRLKTEKALKKVSDRIDPRRLFWRQWIRRAAAILLLPLLISTLLMYMYTRRLSKTEQMIEVRTNPGMTTFLTLPDSTRVYLNTESTLRYPSSFTGDIRQVELHGEGYFEVSPNPRKRFVVSTAHRSRIEVYGTSFNIEAYDRYDQVTLTLTSGHVGFFFDSNKGRSRRINLKAHQKLVYHPADDKVLLSTVSGETETAWKDGKIIFNDTPMPEILRMLEKRFHVSFVIKNKRLNEYSFTGTFTTQRLERIMDFFKISSKINWHYLNSPTEDEKQQIEIY